MSEMEHNNDPQSQEEKDFFSKLEAPYSKSKEDVWASLEKLTTEKKEEPKEETKVVKLNWKRWSIAAAVLILVGAFSFMRFYTISFDLKDGEFANVELPDGSVVYLNAGSELSFHPYWWTFSREVEFEGEGFFEVEKGSTFSVHSDIGTTSVLGTSFNIFAREGNYQVYCKTGKVKVEDNRSNEVVITPGQFASVNEKGIGLEKTKAEDEVLSWRLQKFIYNSTPLPKVISDIERHFAVSIEVEREEINEYFYTGLFDRTSAEEALTILCVTFEMNFEKTSEKSFKIK